MLLFGWLIAGLGTLIASLLWAIRAGQEPRWGTERALPVMAGSGAFRSGDTAETRARRAPIVVWAASLAAIVWAIASGFLVAPVAALLSLSALESGADHVLPFACLAASALGIAIALGSCAGRLLVRAGNAPRVTLGVALASVAHHVGLAAVCLPEGMRPVLPYAALIAGLGILHALVLHLAGRRVGQLEPA